MLVQVRSAIKIVEESHDSYIFFILYKDVLLIEERNQSFLPV